MGRPLRSARHQIHASCLRSLTAPQDAILQGCSHRANSGPSVTRRHTYAVIKHTNRILPAPTARPSGCARRVGHRAPVLAFEPYGGAGADEQTQRVEQTRGQHVLWRASREPALNLMEATPHKEGTSNNSLRSLWTLTHSATTESHHTHRRK